MSNGTYILKRPEWFDATMLYGDKISGSRLKGK